MVKQCCGSKGMRHKKGCTGVIPTTVETLTRTANPGNPVSSDNTVCIHQEEAIKEIVNNPSLVPFQPAPLEAKFDKLLDVVSELAEKVSKLQTVNTMTVTMGQGKSVSTTTPRPVQEEKLNDRVPPQWRAVVDAKLGTDFDIKVEDTVHGDFLLYVYLPTRYDRRVGQKFGRDLSTGLIRRASPLADVEKWTVRIAENIKKSYSEFAPNKA